MNSSLNVANFNTFLSSHDSELKKSIKQTNIALALCDRTNIDIKGVEYKKSVEKTNHKKLSENNENFSAKKKSTKNMNISRVDKKKPIQNSSSFAKPKNSLFRSQALANEISN